MTRAARLRPGHDAPDPGVASPSALNACSEVRMLRPLAVEEGPTGEGDPVNPFIACVVDCETTGLGPDDAIIELAVRRFKHDRAGVVTEVGHPFTWRQDPGRPLDPTVVRLTGITDSDLAGQAIDDRLAEEVIGSADLVIAHNAGFDRRHVERRLPGIAGRPWACSMAEVDWAGRGMSCGKLVCLLGQVGFWHGAHRADADVDAVIALLRHRSDDGVPALAELLARSGQDGWVIRAVGSNIATKDALKARGYSWNPGRPRDGEPVQGHWWIEVPDDAAREREEWWLAANVYSVGAGARRLGPEVERVTCRERWR